MEAGLVEQLFQVFVDAAGVGRTGAGDDEDQRRLVVLAGQAVLELLHCPEVVGQGELTVRAQVEAVVGLADFVVAGQGGALVRRRGGDGCLERVGQGVAIACGVDIPRRSGHSHEQAAEQGSEAQRSKHVIPQKNARSSSVQARTTTGRAKLPGAVVFGVLVICNIAAGM
ncbi:hypothetical protein D3C75_593680 [compost metagenome]